MSVSTIIANQREAYRAGFIDAMRQFSYTVNGVSYVGAKCLRQPLYETEARLNSLSNFHPEKVEDL